MTNYFVQSFQFIIDIMQRAVNMLNDNLFTVLNFNGNTFIIRWLDIVVVMLVFFLVFKFVFFRH